MIIHSYLTDGFYPWAKFFVETFKYHNGEHMPMVLCTRNLVDEQVAELYSLYGNLEVLNEHIDVRALAEEFNMNYKKLLKCKNQVEKAHITPGSMIWKQYTSADQRIRNIYDVMLAHKEENHILHWDIDMYIRNRLDDLFSLVRSHDISIRFRHKSKEHRKVMGGLIGFKINDHVFKFMQRWIKYLNDVPIPKRKIGYGQTSFYYAYLDLKKDYNWGEIPVSYISSSMKQKDRVWSANTEKGKTENLKICRKDFEKCKKLC